MLTQAQAAIRKAGITNIETLEADAADLSAAPLTRFIRRLTIGTSRDHNWS